MKLAKKVFHIFEHHSLLTISELKNSSALLLEGNVDNVQTPVCKFLDKKKLSVVDYCTNIKREEAFADEIAIYLLSIVTGLHCAVMYRDGAWFTCQNKSEKHCDIVLAYTGGTTFIELAQSYTTVFHCCQRVCWRSKIISLVLSLFFWTIVCTKCAFLRTTTTS